MSEGDCRVTLPEYYMDATVERVIKSKKERCYPWNCKFRVWDKRTNSYNFLYLSELCRSGLVEKRCCKEWLYFKFAVNKILKAELLRNMDNLKYDMRYQKQSYYKLVA